MITDETSLSEKDKMPVSIFRTRTIWRGTKTKDVIVPQANFPRINLHVEEESKGLYFYNDKLKVVTCGRTLKSMMPTPVYDYILPRLLPALRDTTATTTPRNNRTPQIDAATVPATEPN